MPDALVVLLVIVAAAFTLGGAVFVADEIRWRAHRRELQKTGLHVDRRDWRRQDVRR